MVRMENGDLDFEMEIEVYDLLGLGFTSIMLDIRRLYWFSQINHPHAYRKPQVSYKDAFYDWIKSRFVESHFLNSYY